MDSRELDVWLWQHLFGWKLLRGDAVPKDQRHLTSLPCDQEVWISADGTDYRCVNCGEGVPDLSTTFEGVGLVEAAMRKKRWTLSLITRLDGGALAEFWLHGDTWVLDSFKAEADTVSLAVALAAKAALEGEK